MRSALVKAPPVNFRFFSILMQLTQHPGLAESIKDMETLTHNPSSNTTSLQSHWVSEPATRGTYGILSLCLSTMLISVWSALHLDIPTKRLSSWKKIGRSLYWIMMGLLCPEIILYNAICQLWWARRLAKLMSDARGLKLHRRNYSIGETAGGTGDTNNTSDGKVCIVMAMY